MNIFCAIYDCLDNIWFFVIKSSLYVIEYVKVVLYTRSLEKSIHWFYEKTFDAYFCYIFMIFVSTSIKTGYFS